MTADRLSAAVAPPSEADGVELVRKGQRALHPKKYIISFRVNAQEWEKLKQRTEDSGSSLTTLLRSCIQRLTEEEGRRL